VSDVCKKFFLFLGDTNREGVLSKLKTSDFEYVNKRLESGVDNHKKIIKLLKNPNLMGVITTLPSHVMRICVSDSHLETTRHMFELIHNLPHLVFIHETFFRGTISVGPNFETYSFGYITDADKNVMNALLHEFDLTIAPYKTNAEMSVLTTEFVDTQGSNLAFRMYIPRDRLWSNETGVMIGLFRDYLTRVGGLRVRQEERSTPLGTVYELFADVSMRTGALMEEFRDFSRLLDTTLSDPDAARSVLESKNLNPNEVSSIIDKYAKEARRLHIDLFQFGIGWKPN
jgi:hypothetical protein